jgi:hypothetical protein
MSHLFGDLYKPVKKIVEDNFNSDKVKLTIKTKANDDLDVELNGDRKGTDLNGDLSWKQVFRQNKAKYTVTGKLDVQGSVSATTEVENLQEGLTLDASGKLLVDTAGKEKDNVSVGAKYKHKNFTAGTSVKKEVGKPVSVTGNAVALYKGLAVGAQVKLNVNAPAKADTPVKPVVLTGYDLAVRYDVDNLTLAAAVEESLSKVKVGYTQQVRSDLAVGAEFAHDLKTAGAKPKLTAVVSKQLDADSAVATKLGLMDGDASVAYKLKVNRDLEALFTVQSNILNLNNNSKLGMSFTYSPVRKE